MKFIDVMLLAQANELAQFRAECSPDPLTKEQRAANARLQEDIASNWAMQDQANRADPYFPGGAS